ncbi:hypothetical protein PPNSA23_28380 [Phyllobacterium phragmitis]|uniref:Uncharacterized protein n=1 Tax=Phyllobacterium phragmitis TaxID=2670329 RepID=A0ABQ0H1W8_9HYPH
MRNYGNELAHWIRAFEPFVEHAFKPALPRLQAVLERGQDASPEKFEWDLKEPIATIVADSYDKRGGKSHKVRLYWQFESIFRRGAETRRKNIWTVAKMVTQIQVRDATTDDRLLHFHVDMKNLGQLGPHIHLQLSEEYMADKVGSPIAVPRFPFATVLPTDCLDFVLSEFFPTKWPKSQSEAHGLKILQTAQRKRLTNMAEAIAGLWEKPSKQTPVSITQDYHMPDFEIA